MAITDEKMSALSPRMVAKLKALDGEDGAVDYSGAPTPAELASAADAGAVDAAPVTVKEVQPVVALKESNPEKSVAALETKKPVDEPLRMPEEAVSVPDWKVQYEEALERAKKREEEFIGVSSKAQEAETYKSEREALKAEREELLKYKQELEQIKREKAVQLTEEEVSLLGGNDALTAIRKILTPLEQENSELKNRLEKMSSVKSLTETDALEIYKKTVENRDSAAKKESFAGSIRAVAPDYDRMVAHPKFEAWASADRLSRAVPLREIIKEMDSSQEAMSVVKKMYADFISHISAPVASAKDYVGGASATYETKDAAYKESDDEEEDLIKFRKSLRAGNIEAAKKMMPENRLRYK